MVFKNGKESSFQRVRKNEKIGSNNQNEEKPFGRFFIIMMSTVDKTEAIRCTNWIEMP